VFIIILQELWEISRESKSIIVENMEKRNGNVRNVRKFMLFNRIGKLTPKLVALENIDVTVEPFSQGNNPNPNSNYLFLVTQKDWSFVLVAKPLVSFILAKLSNST